MKRYTTLNICVWLLYAGITGGCASQQQPQVSSPPQKASQIRQTSISSNPEPKVAEKSVSKPEPRDELRARAMLLWTARVDRDWPTLYQMGSAEERSQTTEGEYVALMQDKAVFRFNSFSLHDIEVEDNYGWVEVESECTLRQFPAIPPQKNRKWERWLRHDGAWRPCSAVEAENLPTIPRERDLDEEKVLRQRFDEFCQIRISSDFEQLFLFLPPEIRQGLTFPTFLAGEKLFRILSCDVDWVEVVGRAGRVRVTYLVLPGDSSLSKLPPSKLTVIEKWHKADGVWYRTTRPDLGCGSKQ